MKTVLVCSRFHPREIFVAKLATQVDLQQVCSFPWLVSMHFTCLMRYKKYYTAVPRIAVTKSGITFTRNSVGKSIINVHETTLYKYDSSS